MYFCGFSTHSTLLTTESEWSRNTCVYAAENRLSIRWTVEDQSSQSLTNGLINQMFAKRCCQFFFLYLMFLCSNRIAWPCRSKLGLPVAFDICNNCKWCALCRLQMSEQSNTIKYLLSAQLMTSCRVGCFKFPFWVRALGIRIHSSQDCRTASLTDYTLSLLEFN